MSEAKDLTEIRQQIQQRSAEQKLTQRSTMSVPEMRKLLGLKKTDSYWLVHKNLFKTQIIGGMMRIDLESFEKWYANQVKYKKVGGEEPGKELRENLIHLRKLQIFWEYMTVTCTIFGKMKSWSILQWIL